MRVGGLPRNAFDYDKANGDCTLGVLDGSNCPFVATSSRRYSNVLVDTQQYFVTAARYPDLSSAKQACMNEGASLGMIKAASNISFIQGKQTLIT